jgi:hypothetical protein
MVGEIKADQENAGYSRSHSKVNSANRPQNIIMNSPSPLYAVKHSETEKKIIYSTFIIYSSVTESAVPMQSNLASASNYSTP